MQYVPTNQILRKTCLYTLRCKIRSLQNDGEAEIRSIEDIINQIEAELGSLEVQMRERDDEIDGLQTEKQLQSNGEMKELVQVADDLSNRQAVVFAIVLP